MNNDQNFQFAGYGVEICYDDYSYIHKFYPMDAQNRLDLEQLVHQEVVKLENCESFYYISVVEIFHIINDKYLDLAQENIMDNIETPPYALAGKRFKYTIVTPKENFPSSVVIMDNINNILPMLLDTNNNKVNEDVAHKIIEMLKQLIR
jgi:N-acetylmuramoyl-L-alanine amidase CwlA